MDNCAIKNKKNYPPRIGLVGPCSPPWTGTTVLFQHLLDELSRRKIVYKLVPIRVNIRSILHKLISVVTLVWRIFRCFIKSDVISIHLPTDQLATLGLLSIVCAKLLKKPLIIRKFGGLDFAQLNIVTRFLSAIVLKNSNLVLVESRGQCREIKDWLGIKVCWYPNNRPVRRIVIKKQVRTERCFVYIGQVRRQKGIQEVVEVVESLEGKCMLDVYGPLYSDIGDQDFQKYKYVYYKGVLENHRVPDILAEYDALIYPTYWPGEGYPGIIIEAFCAGVPVVATNWRFVPEVVDSTCGLLVPPKDKKELRAALLRLIEEDNLMERLRAGAKANSERFSSEKWADAFLEINQAVHECRINMQALIDDIMSLAFVESVQREVQ
jgi:glycosyltransferase involved in cell wall biosynthesis